MAKEGSTLTKVRDYALILLPVAYAVGFLSWSIHLGRTGLGFQALPLAQYLVPAVPVAAVSALGGLGVAYLSGRIRNARNKPFVWPLLVGLVEALCFGMAAYLVAMLMLLFGMIQWTGREFLQVLLLVSIAGPFFHASAQIPSWIEAVRNHWRQRGSPEDDEKRMRRRLRPTGPREDAPESEFVPNWSTASIPSAGVLIALTLMFGHSVLGDIPADFGGGAPRAAYLDIDPSMVEPRWQSLLFSEGTDLNATVARTFPVEVHHRNSDFILFRTAKEPDIDDRLFDLSTDVVKGIVWCGNSCDTWLPAANP